jgi:hypothetical protein
MKVKFRLDPSAIKDFFAQHLEKIVLTVVVLVFLLFVYSSMGHERLDFTPGVLSEEVQKAKEHIEKADSKHFIGKLKGVDYLAESHRIRNPIQVDPYQYANLWNPPLFGIPQPRVPQLYTVQALRGEAGYGAMTAPLPKTAEGRPDVAAEISAMSPVGATQVVGQRWVVLTGLIDLAKQMEAYRDAFGNTVVSKFAGTAPSRGMTANAAAGLEPEYRWVTVERVEVADDGEIDESKWQLVNSMAQLKITGVLADPRRPTPRNQGMDPSVQGGDVVASSFLTLSSYVAFPLPPVHNHRWGPEVAHAPEIPLHAEMVERLREEQLRQLEAENLQEEPTEGAEAQGKDDTGAPPDVLFPEDGTNPMGLPGEPEFEAMGGNRRRTPFQGPEGPRQLGQGMIDPGGTLGNASSAQATREAIQLFRFFDFTVEPGKRYRYRVCVWLTNPSLGVPAQFRSNLPPELATDRFLKSEWSEPSDIVAVPRDSRLLAGTVKSARTVTTEPAANLMLVHFEEKTGEEKSLDLPDLIRGQLVNYIQDIEMIFPNPQQGNNGQPGNPPDPDDPPVQGNPPRQAPAGKQNKQTVTNVYHSEALLLDMLGGDRLTSRDQKLTRPGQVLLLDPDGNLTVRGELDDAQSIARYKPAPPTTAAPPPERQPGQPGAPGTRPGARPAPAGRRR